MVGEYFLAQTTGVLLARGCAVFFVALLVICTAYLYTFRGFVRAHFHARARAWRVSPIYGLCVMLARIYSHQVFRSAWGHSSLMGVLKIMPESGLLSIHAYCLALSSLTQVANPSGEKASSNKIQDHISRSRVMLSSLVMCFEVTGDVVRAWSSRLVELAVGV